MYLRSSKLKSKEALPSLSKVQSDEMSATFEVKGATIEASASDSDKPASDALSALQSLAPSPHIPTISPESF